MNIAEETRKVALEFWKERGAKFGKIQQLSDIDTTGLLTPPPAILEKDSARKFLTMNATIDGHNGILRCELWIIPFKKDGSSYKNPIRFSWAIFRHVVSLHINE